MWFGTNDGLNRYDGYNFNCYRHDEENPHSIGLGRISVLFVDKKGRLWVGTDQGGLSLYNPYLEQFDLITTINKFNPEVSNIISDINETTEGYLWIATYEKGLILMNPETFEIHPVVPQKIRDITCMEYTKDGGLLLGTLNGLYLMKQGNKKDSFQLPEPVSEFNDINVTTLYTDSSGLVWVGTYGKGAFSYDFKTHHREEYSTKAFKKNHRLTHDIVRDIIEDNNGDIIFGTGGGGLNVLLKEQDMIVQIAHKFNYQYSINSNIIYSLYRDDIGNLWIGTYNGGANVVFKTKDKFGHIISYGDENSLSNNSVLAILEAPDGKLFIGTDGGGLDIFDPSTKKIEHINHTKGSSGTISSNVIKCLHLDSRGILWIGTFNAGLTAYNTRLKTIKQYLYQPEATEGLSNNDIWDIDEDRQGNIWIATLGGGLNMFDPKENRFTIFRNNPDDTNSISDNVVASVLIDSKDRLWIGTEFGGICRLTDFKKGTFKTYKRSENKEVISSNQIAALYEDSHGKIWAGTIGGGLICYNEANNNFINYTESDGLANNLVLAILEDNMGNMWISTNNGLSEFINGASNPKTCNFLNFTKNDGLQSNEFSPQAACKTKNGILYFGGINGITYFNPAHIVFNDHVPPIVLTDFKIFNKTVGISEKGSPLKQRISLTKEIILYPKQTVITFEFAALDFTMPSENQYKYKLEGFEEEWNEVGNKRTATYTNLNPGTYTFRVIGSNNDDIWNTEGVALKLIVKPPYYKTWAFRTVLVVLILLGFLTFYRLKLRSLEKHKRVLKKLVNERTSELLEVNSVLEKRNRVIQVQREKVMAQKENLLKTNRELKRNQKKVQEQNIELENHRHNLEELVKQRTSELEKARQKAEESDRLKTSFLSNMSHEIRTPLNAIVGFSSLLAEEDLSAEEKEEFLIQINANTDTLLILIDDILDLSKIEANQLALVKTKIKLHEFVDELYKTMLIRKPPDIDFRINNTLENDALTFVSDRIRLRQVLVNLLDNSFKFTNKGYIELGVTKYDNSINFYVEDTGIGMSEIVIEKIFERFYKMDTTAEKIYRGTGLGLTISKKLINLLGGKIKVLSKVGKGSRFDITLPFIES